MISIEVINSTDRVLAGALTQLNNIQPALRQAMRYQQKSFLQQFAAEGVPRWEPWAESTRIRRVGGKRKEAKLLKLKTALETRQNMRNREKRLARVNLRLTGGKILQDSGKLRRSYVGRTGDSIFSLGRYQVVFGSALVYAAIHQEGGWAGRDRSVHIPQRPLRFLDRDRSQINAIMRRFVANAFKRRGW